MISTTSCPPALPRVTWQVLPQSSACRQPREPGRTGRGGSSAAVSGGSRPPAPVSVGRGRHSSTQALAGNQARPPPLPGLRSGVGCGPPPAPGPAPRCPPLPGRGRLGRRSAASAARAAALELRRSRRRRPAQLPSSPRLPLPAAPAPCPAGAHRPGPAMATKKAGSRLETEIERCRSECQWERIPELVKQLSAKLIANGAAQGGRGQAAAEGGRQVQPERPA